MYYPDLSPYDYVLPVALKGALKGVLTVGWLDHLHDFPKGTVSEVVVSKLAQLLVDGKDVKRMRSIYPCVFCPRPPTPFHLDEVRFQLQGKQILLGMSEIWIPAPTGIIYAAPSMIYHYITVHQYMPPREYLDAVEAFDLSSNWDGEKEMEALYQEQLKQQK